jgi:hypothetical protein
MLPFQKPFGINGMQEYCNEIVTMWWSEKDLDFGDAPNYTSKCLVF